MPVARTPEPTRAPVALNAAESLVRSYIDALRRGDAQTAASYLANGEPDESFITSSTQITSVSASQNSDGSYTVIARLQTSGGIYVETFVVAATDAGNKILVKSYEQP